MASSRPSSPSKPSLNLRPSLLLKTLTVLGFLIAVISYSYWSRLAVLPTNFIHRKPLPSKDFQFDNPTGQNWTHRIWQTSKNPVVSISEEEREHVKTWSDLNPEYRHEVLTDDMMDDYVKDHFKLSHPSIEQIYFEVKDYIIRSDLIRYLILLADGGVYNDLDVGCQKPIRSWVPSQFKDSAGILLGVEVDNKFGPDGRTFQGGQDLFQLVNWTIMSKPNQPFMWFLVNRVLENIKNFAASQKQPISNIEYSIQNVLDVTGPAALTKAFFDYASNITTSNVTYLNFTKMTEPRLIGEVVILPIQAFGAGHQVQWAGWEPDGSELIHHYFAGSWKVDHVDKIPDPPSVDQEEKQKEEDKKKAAKEKQIEDEKKQEEEEKKKISIQEATKEEPVKETNGKSKDQMETPEINDDQDSKAVTDGTKDTSKANTLGNTQAGNMTDTQSKSSEVNDENEANDKPASVQYVEDQVGEESMMEKIEKAKAETEAKERKMKEQEAKEKAAKEEEEAKQKALEEKNKAEQKAKEEKESHMTKEEKEEEERKQKWEEVKAAAPLQAQPKSEEEKQKATNNLADYDYQPD